MERSSPVPLVSVGVPTFNRPLGLARTLACMTGQTYRRLEIIVSDNHSSDPRVADVLARHSKCDLRVRILRQASNIGPMANFRAVLREAKGTYFMWAADDDTWEAQYIDKLVRLLERDAGVGLAFSNFDALDGAGHRISTYPPFLPRLRQFAGKPVADRIASYICQEERHGKANLIYGLFRKSVLEAAGGFRTWGLGTWGADMLVVCSVLAISDCAIDSDLLYHVGPHIQEEVSRADSPVKRWPRRTSWWASASTWLRYAGYLLGYARIVVRAPLGLRARWSLCRLILKRLPQLVSAERVPSPTRLG